MTKVNGKVWNVLGVLLLVLALAFCAGRIWHNCWLYEQPKFTDQTIELGESLPEFSEFLTEYADPRLAEAVTPLDQIDLTHAGTHTLTFRHGSRVEQVTLTVQDTVAPTASFHDVSIVTGTALHPEDFVTEVFDLSGTTVTFASDLTAPASYGDVTVEVVVTDASGNATTGTCRVYYVWMHDSFTMELGDAVTKADLLIDPMKDNGLLDQAELDAINAAPAGTYTVVSTDGDQSCQCVITVQDTTPPELVLQEVAFFIGGTAELEDFLVSATDLSGEVTVRLVTELDFETPGIKTVVIEATDINGNVTTAETTLTIKTDDKPPVFYGMTNMTVQKHSTPDYRTGISAYDNLDGYVSFTVDASQVDTSKRGTYYVTYTATDSSGNKATYRRKVTVSHDAEDTAALIREVASKLSDDPEEIRDYVRSKISYSYSWGGGDPIWFGLTNKHGNCYVHNKILLALLQEKGYTAQLIWVTDKTHYWVLVNLDGVWRHIDATPGPRHSVYSLMTDAQRLATLQGRDWDHSAWPAAE